MACPRTSSHVCTPRRSIAPSFAESVSVIQRGALVALLAALGATPSLTAQTLSAEAQIAGAIQPAPAMDQTGATVLGFRPDGSLTTLRRGSNSLICLADDPKLEGWSAACYHDSLEPFMARGRALRAEGVTDATELAQTRWDEADAGTLEMPTAPATLYVLTGDSYDPANGSVSNSFLRWVVYTPWATAESTGMSPQPGAPGAPWLMFPGTAGAHIMITPPMPGVGN